MDFQPNAFRPEVPALRRVQLEHTIADNNPAPGSIINKDCTACAKPGAEQMSSKIGSSCNSYDMAILPSRRIAVVTAFCPAKSSTKLTSCGKERMSCAKRMVQTNLPHTSGAPARTNDHMIKTTRSGHDATIGASKLSLLALLPRFIAEGALGKRVWLRQFS